MNDVGLDHQIVMDELGRIGVVGMDAPYLGGCQNDVFRFFGGEEGLHGCLVTEFQLRMGAGNEVGVPLGLQATHKGGTDKTTVTGYIDF